MEFPRCAPCGDHSESKGSPERATVEIQLLVNQGTGQMEVADGRPCTHSDPNHLGSSRRCCVTPSREPQLGSEPAAATCARWRSRGFEKRRTRISREAMRATG